MRILIETIDHKDQRYPTCGDYRYLPDGTLYITVSSMGDERYETLVALHEFCEERLTKWKGITEEEISLFDLKFESNRKEGNWDEPGFATDAPYREAHTISTGIEMIMAANGNINWSEYDKIVNSL